MFVQVATCGATSDGFLATKNKAKVKSENLKVFSANGSVLK